jgi:hypothetical protein
MKTFSLALLACGIALLPSISAQAKTKVRIGTKHGQRYATADDAKGARPMDFKTYGAGESEEFLDSCYVGEPEKVAKVMETICEDTAWSLHSAEVRTLWKKVVVQVTLRRKHPKDEIFFSLPACEE